MKRFPLDNLAGTLNMVSDTFDSVIADRPASFSWRAMLNGAPPTPSERRRFIEIRPVLDYTALLPGKAATDAIRQAASDLGLAAKYRATLRLTGEVAIADEEYATLQEGAFVNTTATIVVVLTILWLALRSPRLILAVFVSLLVGFSITAAVGLALVGALNLISVAFAVLFIGLGVDFGIQFSVRYRAERHEVDDLRQSLLNTAKYVGAPLTLAAAATAAGFLLVPADRLQGSLRAGLLAGLGMIVAFLTSVTLIPSLLMVLRSSRRACRDGVQGACAGGSISWSAGASRSSSALRLLSLQACRCCIGCSSISTRSICEAPRSNRWRPSSICAAIPRLGASSIYVLAPDREAAERDAQKLARLPEVASVRTLESFVPTDQEPKLAAIRQLATVLDPVLQPDPNKKPPTDADNVAALKAADKSVEPGGRQPKPAKAPGLPSVYRRALAKLAQGDEALRGRAQAAMIVPLHTALDELRNYLQAQPVTLETLPPEIAREWVTQDGRFKVEILPKGDPNDNETLRRFASAVQAVGAERHRRSDLDSRIGPHRRSARSSKQGSGRSPP